VNAPAKSGDDLARFHRIRSISIIGGFLDGQSFELADGLNCIIGGRGTGKTTVLELIRWALDQMPDQGEASGRYRSIHRLIEANLGTGRVSLEIETLDHIRYRVHRTCDDDAIVLDDNGDPVDIDIGRGNIFSAEVYSQNQIEDIADDPLFQLKIIDKFVADKIKEINARIVAAVRDLEASADDILRLRKQVYELEEQIGELPEVTEKLKAFTIPEGTEEAKSLKKESQFKAIRDREKGSLKALRAVFLHTADSLKSAVADLPAQIADCFSEEILAGPNGGIFREIRTLADAGARNMAGKVADATHLISEIEGNLGEKSEGVEAIHVKQEKVYLDLLEKMEKEKDKAKERDRLLRRRARLQESQEKLKKRRDELLDKENVRRSMLRRLSDLKDERYRLRANVAEELSAQLTPIIRVRIEQYGNTDTYRNLLLESMKGSRLKYTQVVDRLVQRIPPHEFAAIAQRGDVEALKDHLEIDADRANRIILQLKDFKAIFDIETAELHDRPTIELKDGPDYKDSSILSTGQKCTTILPILLLKSESPLLIDQPEDNLDNAFVYETVVKSVRRAKGSRQLLFITHNPNIPVLGDAERVFVLQSSGRKASLKAIGTVDEVKDEIERILEGGKEAFRRRKERYGY